MSLKPYGLSMTSRSLGTKISLMEKYHVIDSDGEVILFYTLNSAIDFARRVSSEVWEAGEDDESDVVWSPEDET